MEIPIDFFITEFNNIYNRNTIYTIYFENYMERLRKTLDANVIRTLPIVKIRSTYQ